MHLKGSTTTSLIISSNNRVLAKDILFGLPVNTVFYDRKFSSS